jgi:hypothetical protein
MLSLRRKIGLFYDKWEWLLIRGNPDEQHEER